MRLCLESALVTPQPLDCGIVGLDRKSDQRSSDETCCHRCLHGYVAAPHNNILAKPTGVRPIVRVTMRRVSWGGVGVGCLYRGSPRLAADGLATGGGGELTTVARRQDAIVRHRRAKTIGPLLEGGIICFLGKLAPLIGPLMRRSRSRSRSRLRNERSDRRAKKDDKQAVRGWHGARGVFSFSLSPALSPTRVD